MNARQQHQREESAGLHEQIRWMWLRQSIMVSNWSPRTGTMVSAESGIMTNPYRDGWLQHIVQRDRGRLFLQLSISII